MQKRVQFKPHLMRVHMYAIPFENVCYVEFLVPCQAINLRGLKQWGGASNICIHMMCLFCHKFLSYSHLQDHTQRYRVRESTDIWSHVQHPSPGRRRLQLGYWRDPHQLNTRFLPARSELCFISFRLLRLASSDLLQRAEGSHRRMQRGRRGKLLWLPQAPFTDRTSSTHPVRNHPLDICFQPPLHRQWARSRCK